MDTLLTSAAALCAATTLQTKAIHEPNDPPTSLKTGDHVRVQTERRRTARAAVNASASLESLRPMLERARADSAITEARSLLDAAERELVSGKHEQAMLTLDGAALRLREVSRSPKSAEREQGKSEVFRDLETRENSLRQRLGQPTVQPLNFETPARTAGDRETDPTSAEPEDKKPVPPKRDELPVG